MRTKITITTLIFFTTPCFGQSEAWQILYQFDKESMKVRWVISDFEQLARGFQSGYELTLFKMENDQSIPLLRQEIYPLTDRQIAPTLSQPGDSLVFEIFSHLKSGNYDATDENELQWQTLGLLLGLQENFSLSKALGLGYEFTGLDTSHVYELILAIPPTLRRPGWQVAKSTIRYQVPDLPVPAPPRWTCMDNRITISSNVVSTSESYGSYRIDRKSPDGRTCTLNQLPLLPNYEGGDPRIFLIDTIGKEGAFSYFILGKDIWGNWGPPSEAVTIEPCHITYLPPHPLICQEVAERGKVILEWSIPDSLRPLIEGFTVYRSANRFDQYERIIPQNLLSAHQLTFTDHDPLSVGFYRVDVHYQNQIIRQSVSKMVALIDTRPPPVPLNVTSHFDTSDFTVTLRWDSILTEDFRGYRVYFSPEETGEKFLLTNIDIRTNTFVDTIPPGTLLTQKYYWVTARDINQNESLYSDSVIIKFPDRFPPIPPRISEIRYDVGKVMICWEQSPSKDILAYTLQRRRKGNHFSWQKIIINSITEKNIYIDSLLTPGDTMLYRIKAADSSGLSSYSNIRTASALEPLYLPPIEYLHAEKQDSNITLYFDYPDSWQIAKFRLWAGSDPTMMKTIHFIDPLAAAIRQNIRKKDSSEYFVLYKWDLGKTDFQYFQLQAIRQDGKPSALSPAIQPR